VHYRNLEGQFYEVVHECLNGIELAAILLKIGIYRRESGNIKIKCTV